MSQELLVYLKQFHAGQRVSYCRACPTVVFVQFKNARRKFFWQASLTVFFDLFFSSTYECRSSFQMYETCKRGRGQPDTRCMNVLVEQSQLSSGSAPLIVRLSDLLSKQQLIAECDEEYFTIGRSRLWLCYLFYWPIVGFFGIAVIVFLIFNVILNNKALS